MHRFFAHVLLFLFLCTALLPAQGREELRKLPELVRHYQLHRTCEPEIGFVAFLALHYGSGYARHVHTHDHSELPGKDLPQQHAASVCLAVDFGDGCLDHLLHPPVDEVVAHWFPDVSCLPSAHLSRIWQPPRLG